jgi:hypothetical protein
VEGNRTANQESARGDGTITDAAHHGPAAAIGTGTKDRDGQQRLYSTRHSDHVLVSGGPFLVASSFPTLSNRRAKKAGRGTQKTTRARMAGEAGRDEGEAGNGKTTQERPG